MKSFIFLCLTAFISQSAFSQADRVYKPSHYLLPDFVKGIVKLKTGTIIGSLNYNSYLESMIIQQGDERRELAALETIDTVYLNNRKFVPAGKGFYEVVAGMPVPFFIQHSCKVKAPAEPVGFGGTSQLTSSTSTATRETLRIFYKNSLPDNYIVSPQQTVFIKKDGEYVDISSSKRVAILFPGKEGVIKKIVKTNKTDFYNAEDVKRLVLNVASM